eukprot:TRINITY_DN7315_c0_g1_i1.p1 TRINITY_DN7315_c0_g1~~TRINITY_DN7315_c0_g1_i1.p1  ORF type:complete len:141 (+),score=58.84 TRINITY_DN7315_c0_g1_i1:869-1291(+)
MEEKKEDESNTKSEELEEIEEEMRKDAKIELKRNGEPKQKRGRKRKLVPFEQFALEGLSDAMESFIRGEFILSRMEDEEEKDPFFHDYKDYDRRHFQGLHFPEVNPFHNQILTIQDEVKEVRDGDEFDLSPWKGAENYLV